MKTNWNGKKVLIIGAARQGLALSRYLCSQGALVTLNDGRPESEMQAELEQLQDLSINWVLGSHPLNLLDECDLICVSGGVPLSIPLIAEAIKKDIPLSNDSEIFLETTSAKVVGITGSSGKTTTTALMGEIAKAAAKENQRVWVGGNIGNPLINQVDEISSNDLVILELSSFQLELMSTSPHIAAITNITPNHLDRHGTLEAYTAAKANILLHQNENDIAILNRDDAGANGLRTIVRGNLVTIGFSPIPDHQTGIFVKDNQLWMKSHHETNPIYNMDDVPMPGKHNIYNVMTACAIAQVLNLDLVKTQNAIKQFKGVPHRLQLIAVKNGVSWYDDSIATAPERTIAAVQSFDAPLVLLLGGKDKNLPWENLLNLVNEKVKKVVLFGDAAEKVKSYIDNMHFAEMKFSLLVCEHLHDAVVKAHEIAEPGDYVLLSPGGTSYDEFKDFEERGEKFKLWVSQLV
jgi:UDP-N-acetylmuramoylalanine--D-glutamate ligase